jgi:Arc/MetJ-type ribon-helix-helix transcriptional regulator
MRQININVTPEFERDLRRLIRLRKYKTQSEAIRSAVHEAAKEQSKTQHPPLRDLLGAALKAPLNPNPRFKSEDDLWS